MCNLHSPLQWSNLNYIKDIINIVSDSALQNRAMWCVVYIIFS